jgi:RNA recognition motif-containing protein
MQVFVGKLDTDVPDATVKQLLDTLGNVLTWKRTTDESGKPKGFGYCTYENPDSVLRALRLLNGFKMGSKQILCKADQSTTAKLETFKAAKSAAGSSDAETENKEDQELMMKIHSIVSGEAPAAARPATNLPQPAPVALAGAEPQIKTEIERFREQELVRQQEMEVRRRERLQERVEASKRKEREHVAREMERKVEEELAKLKDAAAVKGGHKPEVRDGERRDNRERHDDHRDNRDRRDRRDRDRRDRDRDRGGRDDRERKKRRQDDGEEGEVSEYRYEGPESSSPRASNVSQPASMPSAAGASAEKAPAPPVAASAPVKLGFGLATKKKETKPATKPKMNIFQSAEEEGSKKTMKELVPLDYTEDEMLAVKPMADRVAAVAARINAQHQPKPTTDVKSLIEQIPKGKAELFAYPINWSIVDTRGLIESKMKQWVVKKIVEYLGEEEETLIDFVISKLKEHSQPDAILEELALVLEEDAEIFTVKMWRALIFETLR